MNRVGSAHRADIICNSVGTNFGVGVGEARPEGPRAGDVYVLYTVCMARY